MPYGCVFFTYNACRLTAQTCLYWRGKWVMMYAWMVKASKFPKYLIICLSCLHTRQFSVMSEEKRLVINTRAYFLNHSSALQQRACLIFTSRVGSHKYHRMWVLNQKNLQRVTFHGKKGGYILIVITMTAQVARIHRSLVFVMVFIFNILNLQVEKGWASRQHDSLKQNT